MDRRTISDPAHQRGHVLIDFGLQRHGLLALFAAALFGASTPLAKQLLGDIQPITLAGLLYLGSGAGLLFARTLRKWSAASTGAANAEARLHGRDYAWLAGAVLSGGVAAPVLLLWGLSGSTASAASLLLNFEGLLTTLLAALAFREAVGGRIWMASVLMLAGGLLLSYEPAAAFGISPASLAVVGACLLWAIDNNLTRNISAADPGGIAMIKGWTAGTVNVVLGQFAGEVAPAAPLIAAAMALGWFSYGISLVLYVRALRHLGAARTAAHFGTAPFFGALIAVAFFGEPFTFTLAASLFLMGLAAWLALSERHEHPHAHRHMVHTHRHLHDEHHQHRHAGSEGPEPHTHEHVHEPMVHSHPHLPDIHHRHGH
jgi:drug/metabolite transporter (DMT)-like permease